MLTQLFHAKVADLPAAHLKGRQVAFTQEELMARSIPGHQYGFEGTGSQLQIVCSCGWRSKVWGKDFPFNIQQEWLDHIEEQPNPKTYKVVKVVTTKTHYEVLALDEKGAEEAVYWRDSSEREMQDAHKVEGHSTNVGYEIEESSEIEVDACGHFLSQHGRDGCGWGGCRCKRAGPAGFIIGDQPKDLAGFIRPGEPETSRVAFVL